MILPTNIRNALKNLRLAFKGPDTPIKLAAQFVYSEVIEGDYLEFGVFKGASFIEAIREIEAARSRWSRNNLRNNRAAYSLDNTEKADDDILSLDFKESIRFFAFDSFAGLPQLESVDEGHARFRQGRYNCTEKKFIHNVLKNCKKILANRIVTVAGFYNETLNNELKKSLGLKSVSIVMIDCDLYSSTVSVLDFITDLIQDGTIIIFDDWNAYKGSPKKGQRLAAQEWLNKNSHIALSSFSQKGPLQRAFIANII